MMNSYDSALKIKIENIFPGHGPACFGAEKARKLIIDSKNHR